MNYTSTLNNNICWFNALFLDSDASGRPGSGFLSGNLVWLGSYSQCQNTPGAKYCLAPNVLIEIAGQVIAFVYF